jgi:hypothetical protein
MRRLTLAIVTGAVLMIATAGVALAGPPGTNFPEEPGSNVANACAAVVSNPGSGPGGAAMTNASPNALVIVNALFIDACVEGL